MSRTDGREQGREQDVRLSAVEADARKQQKLLEGLSDLVRMLREDHDAAAWELGAMREFLGASGALPLAKLKARAVSRRSALGLRRAIASPDVARSLARCLGPTSSGRLAAVTSGLQGVAGVGLPAMTPSAHGGASSAAAPMRSSLRSSAYSHGGSNGLRVSFDSRPFVIHIPGIERPEAEVEPPARRAENEVEVQRPVVQAWQSAQLDGARTALPQLEVSSDDEIPPLDDEIPPLEDEEVGEAEFTEEQRLEEDEENRWAPPLGNEEMEEDISDIEDVAFISSRELRGEGQFQVRRGAPDANGRHRNGLHGETRYSGLRGTFLEDLDDGPSDSAAGGTSSEESRARLVSPISSPTRRYVATTSKQHSPLARPRYGSPGRTPPAVEVAWQGIPEID